MRNNILVKEVQKGSLGEKAGIEKGDILLSINNNEIGDIIEYKFLICDENIKLKFKKKSGKIYNVEIKKDFYDDMGLNIYDPSMNSPKRCHNKCIFCFIDQLPPGMRESLYIKDDDSRFSFLQGNFITLTNMSDEDLERIIKYRISPVNVSVHTTNPELRIRMLKNKNAGNILNQLKKLTDAGISINCQIVLCPGINDGDELIRTINDLYTFYPLISNIAVVPVGITKYRNKLNNIKCYDKELSIEVINLIKPIQDNFMEKIGEPFIRLADEFYLLAEQDFPDYDHYGEFCQLEDGIGMTRYFEHSVNTALRYSKINGKGKEFAAITGTLIYSFMNKIAARIEKKLNVKLKVYPITNNFFGETINVTGLITGKDLISQLKDIIQQDTLLISKNMLKADEDVFLDDVTINDIEKNLSVKVIVCDFTGEDLVQKIEDEVVRCQNQ